MRATQQLKYAIYGVFDLAYNGSARPVPIDEIGARQRIPARYLEQIFQRLRRAGLVESKRGPGGGYRLARLPEQITLADVALAVDGEVLAPLDAHADAGECRANPAFLWDALRDTLDRALRGATIATLCQEAARRGMPRAETEPAMYHI
jgi:Rrf2 family iron-sulfur cluster assembly transcriptional regulator